MNVNNLLNDLYKKRLQEENLMRLHLREGDEHSADVQMGIVAGLRMAEALIVQRASPNEIEY